MNKVEIIGRLKNYINIDMKDYQCNDVNLDKDFLVDFSRHLLTKLHHSETKIQYEKFFDDEIITKIKFTINVDEILFEFTLSRDTFGNKILIGSEIIIDQNNHDIFGAAYDVKIIVIEVFNKVCENSNIFLLQDSNNEQICQSAYSEIHRVENRFRSILTRYLMKKYGKLILSKSLKKEVDDYSKWFKKETGGKYKTFKRLNTDYANIDFSKLVKILDLKDSNSINEDEESVVSQIAHLRILLDDDAHVDDLYQQVTTIENHINSRRKIFCDKPNKEEVDIVIEHFGSVDVIIKRDILDVLDDSFKDIWENQLSKMRNMIAHNKPICKELYNDIIDTCNEIHNKFDKCDEIIDASFYSDEDDVRSALEDMEIEKERYETDYVEQQREACGIGFPLSESYVETALAESCIEIQNLVNLVNGLEELARLVEEIGICIYEIEETCDNEENLDLESEIRKIIIEELELEIDSVDNNKDLNIFVEKHIFQGLNMQEALQYYTENKDYSDSNFDYFDLNYKVGWYGIDNKRYLITVDGELYPENGGIDDFQFSLSINDENYKTYYVQINYGDYREPSNGYIDASQIQILVDEIESNIENTIKFFAKIHKVSEKIMELF